VAERIELRVPDIGDFKDVPVIEVLVKPGQAVKKNESLITLESEKASMEVPAAADGTISEVSVKVGDKVTKGTLIATLESTEPAAAPPKQEAATTPPPAKAPTAESVTATPSPAPERRPEPVERPSPPSPPATASPGDGVVHASPSIRRFARELGVDLHEVRGSGPHGRVTRDDVQNFVKTALHGGASSGIGAGLPGWPKVDFGQFGPIERKPLSRIKRIAGPNLHRNWLQIPHITNYDEADVTGLEKFRRKINKEQEKIGGTKLTMLSFLIKACVAALKQFPEFNSSLDGDSIVYKRYYNIGFAADTKDGLLVPVIKEADKKGLLDLAAEAASLAAKARDGKLSLGEMSGGTFSISSIGSIGGTQFTQIVNAPEVAILGATRATIEPVWQKKKFVPRLIQPISVSYDHRVIDGATAARFLVYVAEALTDVRRAML
jgi:pyruvate dehydrogenase E2 component (dihydrolipoamide acetyltransferase)